MQRSYSKKAFPWDNACIESFHAVIKREFEYLEAFYNTKRIHSHCNYMSPDEFEKLYQKSLEDEMKLAG